MRTVDMSDYTVGEDAFDAIPATLEKFGAKKIVLAGGKRALAAAAPGIKAAVEGTGIEVTDAIVYGTECTQDNIDRLVAAPAFREADVAFAIGGGTYSRMMPNTVAFGLNFPGDTDTCHMPDEYIDIEKMMLSVRIFAHAIAALASGEID